ncbi:AAA family ATPase [Salinicola halimionae]|uniref:AAA family ATPase n=1 Tax=Salinicola halimionae TaxID=1949081 RepID=UPI000DA1F11A|nr:AAA family ATPase [Salinicola halimionae]
MGEVVDGISRGDPKFDHCGVETTDGARCRYLVYNQSFVDRLIGPPMEGIFTVGEVDTTRQQRIDEVIAQAGKLDAKIVTDDARVNEAGQNVDKELKRAKQKIWKAYELVVLNVSLVPIPC